MTRFARLPLALMLAILPGGGIGTAAYAIPAPVPRVAVEIRNFMFVPATIQVAPGTIVTWINRDEDPHLVLTSDHAFRSPALDTGASYSFTFTRPGDYAYYCSLHPNMIGHIVVRAH